MARPQITDVNTINPMKRSVGHLTIVAVAAISVSTNRDLAQGLQKTAADQLELTRKAFDIALKSSSRELTTGLNAQTGASDLGFYQTFRDYVWKTQGADIGLIRLPLSSVENNSTFLRNFRKLAERANNSQNVFVIGGEETAPNEFLDCVALRYKNGALCSGCLVASNAVVAAGHCTLEGSLPAVIVGQNAYWTRSTLAENFSVRGYSPRFRNDLCVYVLASDVPGVVPCKMADPGDVDNVDDVEVVGFGVFDLRSHTAGIKHKVSVPISTYHCQSECESNEFIAGRNGLGKDSCTGDSGCPAYIPDLTGWKIAGITSRAVNESRALCGDGGIYVRVEDFSQWIRSLPGLHWPQ